MARRPKPRLDRNDPKNAMVIKLAEQVRTRCTDPVLSLDIVMAHVGVHDSNRAEVGGASTRVA
jgi:hypothetical protein